MVCLSYAQDVGQGCSLGGLTESLVHRHGIPHDMVHNQGAHFTETGVGMYPRHEGLMAISHVTPARSQYPHRMLEGPSKQAKP